MSDETGPVPSEALNQAERMVQGEAHGTRAGFFEGLLFGLVVGAMLSLLTAPEKGEKLRSYIYQTFEEMAESIDEEVKKSRAEAP